MRISEEELNNFIDYLFETPPYKMHFVHSNKEGFKNIFKDFMRVLYSETPEEIYKYLEGNASSYFLDILYRERGIADYFISRIPSSLKVRISYLLHQLEIKRTTQDIFRLFHEALEEFYPKMNIYTIEVVPNDLNAKPITLRYKLNPQYITDPDNVVDEISETDLSGTYLMKLEQFIDREEKFYNVYTDDKAKRRNVNIFPIKTGILYVQNSTGIGVAQADEYIPIMQTIGATLLKNDLVPWKMPDDESRKMVPFVDFLKLCMYLKFKEFQFKSENKSWTWSAEPFEVYGPNSLLVNWDAAKKEALNTGTHWSTFFPESETKVNNMIIADEDLPEAYSLLSLYAEITRSGSKSRELLNDFKLRWNSLRDKNSNTSIYKASNLEEFRKELVGSEPQSVAEFELLLLEKFTSANAVPMRDGIFQIKSKFKTNPTNTLDASSGLITLMKQFAQSYEFNDFIQAQYGDFDLAPKNEIRFMLDVFNHYAKSNTIPLLTNYNSIKILKFPALANQVYTPDENNPYNIRNIYNNIYVELTNTTNFIKFKDLSSMIKPKYRTIIDKIDSMAKMVETEVEDFTNIFLSLWKMIQVDMKDDKYIRYFWNEYFMRNIMGSTFKDYFYDPIVEMFMEYWFPAETSIQNKDISVVTAKDKLNTIILGSEKAHSLESNRSTILEVKDSIVVTVIRDNGEQQVYEDNKL